MRATKRFDRQSGHMPQFVVRTPRTVPGRMSSVRSHQAQACVGLASRLRTRPPQQAPGTGARVAPGAVAVLVRHAGAATARDPLSPTPPVFHETTPKRNPQLGETAPSSRNPHSRRASSNSASSGPRQVSTAVGVITGRLNAWVNDLDIERGTGAAIEVVDELSANRRAGRDSANGVTVNRMRKGGRSE